MLPRYQYVTKVSGVDPVHGKNLRGLSPLNIAGIYNPKFRKTDDTSEL